MHETPDTVYPDGREYVDAGALHHPRPARPPPWRVTEERPLIDAARRRVGLLFPLLLLFPATVVPAAAQEATAERSDGVRAFAEAGVAGTRIHGEATAVLGLAMGLSVGPGLSIGGAARLLPGPVAVGRVVLQEVELEVGYGGLLLQLRRPAWSDRGAWILRALVGAGNADVLEQSTSLRLDSDNFLVVEPSVGVELALLGPLWAGASISYRFVSGVEDLRGVGASDLRSPSLALRLRISPL